MGDPWSFPEKHNNTLFRIKAVWWLGTENTYCWLKKLTFVCAIYMKRCSIRKHGSSLIPTLYTATFSCMFHSLCNTLVIHQKAAGKVNFHSVHVQCTECFSYKDCQFYTLLVKENMVPSSKPWCHTSLQLLKSKNMV